jgi:hypothetical protein
MVIVPLDQIYKNFITKKQNICFSYQQYEECRVRQEAANF